MLSVVAPSRPIFLQGFILCRSSIVERLTIARLSGVLLSTQFGFMKMVLLHLYQGCFLYANCNDSEQTRVLLTSAAYVHLKHADVSKYTRNLSPASRAILLSGPAGYLKLPNCIPPYLDSLISLAWFTISVFSMDRALPTDACKGLSSSL